MTMRSLLSDITKLTVDAIVNAANRTLLGGGGVDGAIHHAAGPDLLRECKLIGGCAVGEARITRGYRLPAKYVIHTVGPVWSGGAHGEPEQLHNCYVNSLTLAMKYSCASIAFPCISTGAYGYPGDQAAVVAVSACKEFIEANSYSCEITFACFSQGDLEIYQGLLRTPRE